MQVAVGSLFIVPYTGGMIGRLPECEVPLNDVNISKQHAKFGYNEDEKSFTIIDLGSRNGTFIHSVRLHRKCWLKHFSNSCLKIYICIYLFFFFT